MGEVHMFLYVCVECVYTKPGVWRSAKSHEALTGPSAWREGCLFVLILIIYTTILGNVFQLKTHVVPSILVVHFPAFCSLLGRSELLLSS